MAARERHRQRLLDLKAEILAEGDIDLEPGRQDATAVGSDEDAQPLTEMSQAIASSRNRNRSARARARRRGARRGWSPTPRCSACCTECEEPIPEKRLELMPYVELCVECQQATDGPRRGGRRHLRDFR